MALQLFYVYLGTNLVTNVSLEYGETLGINDCYRLEKHKLKIGNFVKSSITEYY